MFGRCGRLGCPATPVVITVPAATVAVRAAGRMVRMLRVGLTGGIGSGKSTVARRLAEHGAVVIDADVVAREVVDVGSDGLNEIVTRFGRRVLDDSGGLDRPAMARLVFGDDEARQALNNIVHPRVAERTAELMALAPRDSIVVHDIPLLVENGYQADYHLVLVVDAPVEDRVRRLVERGLDETAARARIDAQASEAQRREAADVWLDNAGDLEKINTAVDRLHEDRLVPFERNVRSGRHRAFTPPHLVEPDPEWPRRARRLAARVRKAADDVAYRVDHIGSTSVPELAANDVIDLQLSVGSLAAADSLAEALTRAGFPVVEGVHADESHGADPDPEQWQKRVHASADPGCPVNLHLRVEGHANWWFALLLSAWLRADADARVEYESVKRKSARRFASDGDSFRYGQAKYEWFDHAWPRAERWARESGWRP